MQQVNACYGQLERMEPGIARLLAHNPSPFTYSGTQTYLVGDSEVAVIDPGPDLEAHVDAIIEALGVRPLVAILCTHTHRDHSPAARLLRERTDAPIVGCAPLSLQTVGPRADASFDGDYGPDRVLADGEAIEIDGLPLTAVATPGHTSNHLCFAYNGALFSGDHVMAWSTTVVVPPDGDMAAYLLSLEKLKERADRVYFPAHGASVTDPRSRVEWLLSHRREREAEIIDAIGRGEESVEAIVRSIYTEIDSRLFPAAGGSVLAHLLDLQSCGVVVRSGELWKIA